MKFRFCGEGDCPDWVLAEIHSTLSVLKSTKVRTLCKILSQDVIGEEAIPDDVVASIFAANQFDRNSAKSSMAALKYIICSAARYCVPQEIFDRELQQLGLPKEHSNVICKVFGEFLERIRKHQLLTTLSLSALSDIKVEDTDSPEYKRIELATKWEVQHGVVLERNEHHLNIRSDVLKTLVSELEIARSLMSKYAPLP